jgi:hypothetical protein
VLFSVVNRTNYVAIIGSGVAAGAIYNVLKDFKSFQAKYFVHDSPSDVPDKSMEVPTLSLSRFITELETNSGLDTIVVASPLKPFLKFFQYLKAM